MFSSRLTAYFRRKGVAVTDRRVQKMNEILNYIKFIKMYAWVKAFSQVLRSKGRCFWVFLGGVVVPFYLLLELQLHNTLNVILQE